MIALDETHDPSVVSWVESANGHGEFPIQNLPLGIFSRNGDLPRGGVAIGGFVMDMAVLAASQLVTGVAAIAADGSAQTTLNALLAADSGPRRALRRWLFEALRQGSVLQPAIEPMLHPMEECTLQLPATIGDYTDFYAGIHHAQNVGRLFRPDAPLLPNYKHVPIGYHGRASSVRPSGAPVVRPLGQTKVADAADPSFGPTRRLDYELELGIWIGRGNTLGHSIPFTEAEDHIAGLCLLNDWSARDIQAWEYQPLGPFLAKSFMTTVSPWIVTAEALAPFRIDQPARPPSDPQPLAYLGGEKAFRDGAYAITLEVALLTEQMRRQGLAPQNISRGNSNAMYWTAAQLVAHHTSNGCNMRSGDLLGSGTLSGPEPSSFGSLMEISAGGKMPLVLQNGDKRTFLEDGDEIFFTAHAQKQGFVTIGFGECRGTVMPALEVANI
ncbi:MAG TPA: fumarylacetoacetase [Rhizomicrobium sp.]|nr:fumarylacetoacetase [Rhizomicrobium sp.]